MEKLSLECRFLRNSAIVEIKKNRVELAVIDPDGIPTNIEVSWPRLSRHIASVQVDYQTPS